MIVGSIIDVYESDNGGYYVYLSSNPNIAYNYIVGDTSPTSKYIEKVINNFNIKTFAEYQAKVTDITNAELNTTLNATFASIEASAATAGIVVGTVDQSNYIEISKALEYSNALTNYNIFYA